MTHYLIACDDGQSWCQIAFTPDREEVHVIGILGAATHIDKKLPIEEARTLYKEFREKGWVVPKKTTPQTIRQMQGHIYH